MSPSSTVQTKPSRRRNVCIFRFGSYCALEECCCAMFRMMYAKPNAKQAHVEPDPDPNAYLEDVNSSELACMAGGPD